MSLEKLINEELPLNRKERFFTGTVLPMIVCKDNFKHLHGLLELVGYEESLSISAKPGQENVQFFSEYSFVESVVGDAQKRFSNPPKVKDTPDTIILIKTEQAKVLVAIEAKMYDSPSAQALRRQMDDQRNHILAYLQKVMNIDKVYHVALLPAKLYDNVRKYGFDHKTITWEDIYARYRQLLGNDYFLEILRIALERYDELVSKGVQYRKHCEDMYTGRYIYESYKEGTLDKQIMGRDLGLRGPKLRKDITSGEWQGRKYEVSSATEPFNRNWFYIRDFVRLADQLQSSM